MILPCSKAYSSICMYLLLQEGSRQQGKGAGQGRAVLTLLPFRSLHQECWTVMGVGLSSVEDVLVMHPFILDLFVFFCLQDIT
jgi:hypothetical protein